jgi:Zn-dependent peptidase ImmA (M78 family)
MTRVAVKDTVLQWAIERSGMTVGALGRKFPKIRQWETGEKLPTLKQLETLAKATFTPLGYFFLTEPPNDQLPISHFRTVGDETMHRPSTNLLETVQTMQRRQAWMRDFLIEDGQESLQFVRSVKTSHEPHQTANKIRHTLGLDEGWAARLPTWTDALRALKKAMEEAGILVTTNGVVGNNTHRKLDPADFRGFVLVDDSAPLVFVNGADVKAAQMFTLAHELAHVWFGSCAAFDLRELQPADDKTEQACNRVAAEFLIPERKLREIWPPVSRGSEPFQAIARYFKISELVAAQRAQDLALITKNEFLGFYRAY